VKPANMFVCRLGLDVDVLKVLDFGLVKLQHPLERGAEALTVEGAFTGTPGFMPPEVALGEEPIDGRADIYALGCVAYWLLTGKRVFESGNAMEMVIDHVRTAPVPPSQRAGQPIPEALESLIMRCLAKHPAQRPTDAAELSRELAALGLAEHWTEEKAREWWSAHQPETEEDLKLPTIDIDPWGDETRSQADGRLIRRA
jgi:serine/threonine protein kinase